MVVFFQCISINRAKNIFKLQAERDIYICRVSQESLVLQDQDIRTP